MTQVDYQETVRDWAVRPFIRKADTILRVYMMGHISKDVAINRLTSVSRDAASAYSCMIEDMEEVEIYTTIYRAEKKVVQEYADDVVRKMYGDFVPIEKRNDVKTIVKNFSTAEKVHLWNVMRCFCSCWNMRDEQTIHVNKENEFYLVNGKRSCNIYDLGFSDTILVSWLCKKTQDTLVDDACDIIYYI